MPLSRWLPTFGWVLAVSLWTVGLANCVLAFIYPIELEAREGSSWLYVLTQEAGISLYDHSQVAYLNMNHGPLDPLLKYWIHRALPFLESQMVVRCFVLLLPFCLLLLFIRLIQSRLTATLAAGAIYLFILGLERYHFLLGRSDPAAMVFLCGLLYAGHELARAEKPGRRFALTTLVGALAAVISLINWRFGPVAVAPIAAWGAEVAVRLRLGQRTKASLLLVFAWLVGFAVPLLLVFILQLHADPVLYGQHSFYLFLAESGWGAGGMPSFSLFPWSLLKATWLAHLLLLAGLGFTLVKRDPALQTRTRQLAWLILLGLIWVILAYGYYRNGAGGGLYYFGPFYVLVGYAVARDSARLRPSEKAIVGLLIALVLSLPWLKVGNQARRISATLGPAREFRRQVERITAGSAIYSEDIQLLKHRYDGEKIDMGDLVTRVMHSELYDDTFRDTAQNALAQVQSHPPKFVMIAGAAGYGEVYVISMALHDLLVRDYQLVAQSPATFLANAGNTAGLYQLKSTLPAKP